MEVSAFGIAEGRVEGGDDSLHLPQVHIYIEGARHEDALPPRRDGERRMGERVGKAVQVAAGRIIRALPDLAAVLRAEAHTTVPERVEEGMQVDEEQVGDCNGGAIAHLGDSARLPCPRRRLGGRDGRQQLLQLRVEDGALEGMRIVHTGKVYATPYKISETRGKVMPTTIDSKSF